MKRFVIAALRPIILLLLIEAATVFMVRLAPGYFSDITALDPQLSQRAHDSMLAEQDASGGVAAASFREDMELLHGNLGFSRYYRVPVRSLLAIRWGVTLRLLGGSLGFSWLLAMIIAIPVVLSREPKQAGLDLSLLVPVILLLAVPAGSLAALSVASGLGTPMAVMTLFTTPRVYRYVTVLLRSHLDLPHLFYARACGIGSGRLLRVHVLSGIGPELLALVGTSMMMALGAIVPVEVVFDVNGIAQLAWTAALNRDAPVIAATTVLAAGVVAIAGMLSDSFSFAAFSQKCQARGLTPQMEDSI